MSVAAVGSIIFGAVVFVVTYLLILMVPWRKVRTTLMSARPEPFPREQRHIKETVDVANDNKRQNALEKLQSSKGNQDSLAIVAISALAVVGVVAFVFLAGKTNEADFALAEQNCVDWFQDDAEMGAYDAFLSDSWERDGRIVVEVGYDKNGLSYSTRLCVFDPENFKMSAPNNLTRSRWE